MEAIMEHSKELLLKLYKEMVECRMLEAKLNEEYAIGRIPGHIHSGIGEEAPYIGTLATRKKGDYFKLSHRPVSVYHTLGQPLEEYFSELMARSTGNSGGRGGDLHLGRLQDGVVGFEGILGSDAGVSVGAALTAKMRKTDNISYFFYGDGTASRGPLHEAMCLASAWKLPVLFVLDNNGFAISTPVGFSSAVEHPAADRAAGYGMPGIAVDGTDVLAVYDAASELVDYVRSGNGPAVLECDDYRWRGHFEGDKCAYRDNSIAEYYMKEKDPIRNLETELLEAGYITEDEIRHISSDFSERIEAAVLYADSQPELRPDELMDTLFIKEGGTDR